jgi:hypothetical protein
MADAEPVEPSPAPKNNPSLLIFGAFATVFAILGTCGVYFLWPRGERVGAIDLKGGPPTLSVDVGSGDKLNFRIDTITVGTTGSGYPTDSSKSRMYKVEEELERSLITVTAVGNDGVSKESTECRGYAGKSTTGSSESDSATKSGIPLDCSLHVEKGGVYTLTAKVAWVPKDVRHAILEVRREKGGK